MTSGLRRERSLWGWGWSDSLPDEQATARLAMIASAALGGVALLARSAPTLEALRISEPRIENPNALAGFVSSDRFERAHHTHGKSYRDLIRGLSGDYKSAPDLIAKPRSESEVERVLEWASANRVAVIPYGGGTSVVGGIEAEVGTGYTGALSLDMGALNAIHEVDEVSLLARIGAGAMGPHLEEQLAAKDLTLRFFPQSFEFSTLGGWIATRAGGHFATLETHIDDLVASTRAVTPSGIWQTRRLPASGAGPSPDRLMIGSEGTLGVLTEATVRVRRRPTHRSRATFSFAEYHAAIDALRAIAQARLYPANARLLDAREAMIHQVGGPAGKSLLLVAFESSDREMTSSMERAKQIAESCGGVLEQSKQGEGRMESWRSAFLNTPYLFSALVSLGVVVDTFETAVTWDRFDDLHKSVVGAALETMKSARGVGLVSSRITHVYPDGCAPYYTFLTTADRGDELQVWSMVKRAVSDAILEAGGTITHHHAVGRVHQPWYRQQQPSLFGAALRAAKRELDPAGVLNPGVLLGA